MKGTGVGAEILIRLSPKRGAEGDKDRFALRLGLEGDERRVSFMACRMADKGRGISSISLLLFPLSFIYFSSYSLLSYPYSLAFPFPNNFAFLKIESSCSCKQKTIFLQKFTKELKVFEPVNLKRYDCPNL